ncbi:MAG: hypothetical protein OEW75_18110 [Cyclobacteriaceae bacterium]|nr:hypothetical protein [Cyclobacteriaceae bacterium]
MKDIFLLLILLISITSCNEGEINKLKGEIELITKEKGVLVKSIKNLNKELDILKRNRDFSNIDRLELKNELEQTKLTHEEYKFGNGKCITKKIEINESVYYRKICGSENIIEFLNKHYCPE